MSLQEGMYQIGYNLYINRSLAFYTRPLPMSWMN